MKKYAILGYPLKHTMSPPIHARLFELSGIEAEYEILEISPEELENNRALLNSLDGYNITIPHKVSIIDFCDKLDSSAARYTSVNCVCNDGGVHTGYNTDCYGFNRALSAGGASLGGKVLQLGCGGVGRMMAIETILNGGSLTVSVLHGQEDTVDPVIEFAEKNCPNAEIKVVHSEEISGKFDLLVNSTPVGMYPNIDACPVSDEVIAGCDIVFDAIYNPIETALMRKARSMGKRAVGGMAMLVWQAVVAHEIWENASYDEKDIEALIRDMERAVAESF